MTNELRITLGGSGGHDRAHGMAGEHGLLQLMSFDIFCNVARIVLGSVGRGELGTAKRRDGRDVDIIAGSAELISDRLKTDRRTAKTVNEKNWRAIFAMR